MPLTLSNVMERAWRESGFSTDILATGGSPTTIVDANTPLTSDDSLVGGNTLTGPGSDAAVIRIEGTRRAVAVSTDGNGRYSHLDPHLGGAHAVADPTKMALLPLTLRPTVRCTSPRNTRNVSRRLS